MSVEKYLAFERSSPYKHEFVGGHLYAMVGVNQNHSLVAGDIFASRRAMRGKSCRFHQSDMQVRVPGGLFYYPDVIVACNDMPDDRYLENNPCLIVEVLSPSTQEIDRREELLSYRTIPGLMTYLIVEQDVHSVELHYRDDAGQWQSEFISDGAIPVPCPPNASLTNANIYEGVEL